MTNISLVIIPLLISNILHMLVVKYDAFPWLKIPLSVRLFGANKTLRGFIILPILNACVSLLICAFLPYPDIPAIFITGLLLGLAYMLAELPNSLFKRRLGIPSGGSPEKNKWAFALLDKCDSSIGVCLLAWLLIPLEIPEALMLLLLSVGTHIFFSWLLLLFHLKKSF
jgi:CDP-diglyceride synthetase